MGVAILFCINLRVEAPRASPQVTVIMAIEHPQIQAIGS